MNLPIEMTSLNNFRLTYFKLQKRGQISKHPIFKDFDKWRRKFWRQKYISKDNIEVLSKKTWTVRIIQQGFGFHVTGKIDDLVADFQERVEKTGFWFEYFMDYEKKFPDIFENPETQIKFYKYYMSGYEIAAFELRYLMRKKRNSGPITSMFQEVDLDWDDEKEERCHYESELMAYDDFKLYNC